MEIILSPNRIAKIKIGLGYVRRQLKEEKKSYKIVGTLPDEKREVLEHLSELIEETTFLYDFFEEIHRKSLEEGNLVFQFKSRELMQLQEMIRRHATLIST